MRTLDGALSCEKGAELYMSEGKGHAGFWGTSTGLDVVCMGTDVQPVSCGKREASSCG